jgi:hypothetical protein
MRHELTNGQEFGQVDRDDRDRSKHVCSPQLSDREWQAILGYSLTDCAMRHPLVGTVERIARNVVVDEHLVETPMNVQQLCRRRGSQEDYSLVARERSDGTQAQFETLCLSRESCDTRCEYVNVDGRTEHTKTDMGLRPQLSEPNALSHRVRGGKDPVRGPNIEQHRYRMADTHVQSSPHRMIVERITHHERRHSHEVDPMSARGITHPRSDNKWRSTRSPPG